MPAAMEHGVRGMKDDYRILLNFLPVVGPLPPFRVFRKSRVGSELRPDEASASYSFANGNDRDNRSLFWVKREPAEGFVEYRVRPDENNDLTRWALFHALANSARENFTE